MTRVFLIILLSSVLVISISVLLKHVYESTPITVLQMPVPLQVKASSHTAILKWNENNTGAQLAFKVYRSTNGQSFGVVAKPTMKTWTDYNVLPNHSYWYYVTQYNTVTNTESGKSNTIKLTIP
jgi:hypothetical protein